MMRPTPEQYAENTRDPAFVEQNHALDWTNMRSGYGFIAWNTGERNGELTPFHDKRVRQAMTMLIDREAFRTLPPHATLVNIARGPVVDTDALVYALRWNQIRGAFLDVTDPEPLPDDHPLWGLDDARITPHNAGHTPRYFARVADILAGNVDRLTEVAGDAGVDGDPRDGPDLENRVV